VNILENLMKIAFVALGVCLVSALNLAAQAPCQFTTAAADVTETCGRVGIGTPGPGALLDITKPATINLLRVGDGTSYMDWYGNGYNDINAYGRAFRLYSLSNGFQFRTGATDPAVTILNNGFVGIGLTAAVPSSTLQVAGDIRVGSNNTNSDLRLFTDSATILNGGAYSYNQINSITPVTVPAAGNTTHTALYIKNGTGAGLGTNQIDLVVDGTIKATSVIGAAYQDLAEWVPVDEEMPPGTVVVVSGNTRNTVGPSQHAYDTRVAGVVSARPGVLLGEASATKAKIATTGRVRVRVDATKHAIAMGDLLVTSDTSGAAMFSEPLDLGGVKIHRPGTLIGKALEPLAAGQGEILVLLSLQ
jgi:hypothetical protein